MAWGNMKLILRHKIQILLSIVGISFSLNLIWENLQAPLYQGYSNFWQHFLICFVASLGDVLIILFLYFVLAIIRKDIFWIKRIHKNDIVITIILGALVTVGMEKWALATLRWQYASAMPLIPYIEVGLLPVLQMIVLPLMIYYTSRRITSLHLTYTP